MRILEKGALEVQVPREPVPACSRPHQAAIERGACYEKEGEAMSRRTPEKLQATDSSTQPGGNMPPLAASLEQNVRPVINEAQRIAATTSVSGRRAVSRGAIILTFYFWLLSGAILFSWIARRTQFFPGDRSITRTLQKRKSPWLRRLMILISEPGFPKVGFPLTTAVASIFWLLRFRLEALFLGLSGTASLLNIVIKKLVKRPRPTSEEVTVARVINQPSFPSGHVMHYTNLFGMLTYFLSTNWRSGRLRNILITMCVSMIALVGPSRIYLGAHWPSDVMAGYVYGGLWFGSLMALYLRIKAWIHPAKGTTPEAMKPLQQPGDE